ncbi:unnamed protein product [Chironomus riparius]|uniref:Uncharacterized protein n=1 Tax=Chironomus riparius TaxID=315576 RepID=A0A9N9RU15_9DIPT|nr:unnamed protein product [Chironomus riparius]
MKWTSANSKSVFYTSEDSNSIISSTKEQQQQPKQHKLKGSSLTDNSSSLFTYKMGGDDETTESQNSKSSSANNSIQRHNNNNNGTDLKRYLKNFMLFSNLEIESEKKCRDEQLSKIVKALMLFEKKLQKEQEIIQQQLCEKDKVINRQMHTISNMKVKLGVDDGDNDDDTKDNNQTAEFCPMCRKKYYLRATKSMATQTTINGFPNNISDDYSSIQSIEYMSSSEEQEVLLSPNPFSTARRSKKYTSKKSYKGYLQSRPHSGNVDNNRNKSINANALSQSKDFPSSDKNNNTIGARGASIEHINGISKSSICGGAGKFSLIMNDIHGIKQQKQQVDDTHSLKINRMHGISLTTLNVTANEGKEKEILSISPHNNDNSGNVSSIDADSHDDAIKVTVTDDQKEFNDNNNNNNGNHNHNHTIMSDGIATITRKYCDEGLEVKQKFVTRDDWYISDIDENDIIGTPKSSYGNISTGVSNSVLECVNQILLQQSMDEYIESQTDNKPKETTKESQNNSATSTNSVAPTRTHKRVHFSTKNSMVQIKPLPRHQHHHSLPSDINSDDDALNSTYENQSTYSNEYELIGSSRTYVDMDKSTIDNFKPTLPPKPSNLMKLQQIAKQRAFVQDQIYTKKSNSDYELNESEPDYASISEIQDTIKSVKVVTAEIHNDADNLVDNEYSEIKEVPTPTPECVNEDDSFADVPKLPNVYSIIPGIETPTSPTTKKELSTSNNNKCIGHDNYITKSPMKKKIPIANFSSVKKEKEKSKILTEMNNATNKKQQQPPPVPMKHQQTIKIIDEEIQQEFDWYNLDAEYTKTDIVITPQIENIKEMYQFDDENVVNSDDAVVKVEYNLEDFEYETVPSSECSVNGIEIETNNNNFTTVIKINETSSSSSSASSTSSTCEIHKTSPVNKKSTTANLMELAETPKVDFKKNNKIRYEKFLKESGLISKPILMSKKKFYAEGSFV